MKYLKHIMLAAKYSSKGIKFALINETAARIEFVLVLIAFIAAHFIADGLVEYILLIGILVLVLATEMLNTAIEAIIDEDNRHTKLFGAAKDCGSAAVGILSLFGVFVWIAFILKNVVGIL